MNPRYAGVRPDMTVEEAISNLHEQSNMQVKTLYYAYVLDEEHRLLGVASFRDLITAPRDKKIRDVMRTQLVKVTEDQDQEAVSRLFHKHGLRAIPVVDGKGRLKGIVTIDDILDVVQQEATEDIERFGGVEVLDAPYLTIGLGRMLRKRAG